MLKRRLIAALAAVLLAGTGAVLLLNYVSGADQRAMAGLQTANVLVVTAAIPPGTPAASVTGAVALKVLPAKAVVPGSITNLKQVTGLVTTAELLPGEQLLSTRFVDPRSLADAGEVRIPAGFQQVSVSLEAQRVLGGNLVSGAKVAVFFKGEKGASLALRDVLVTEVQGGLTPTSGATSSPPSAAPAPGGNVLVTFALTPADATKVVAATPAIWLSLEPAPPAPGTTSTSPSTATG